MNYLNKYNVVETVAKAGESVAVRVIVNTE